MLTLVTKRLLLAALLACALVAPATGCIETHVLPANIPATGSTTMALVGADGGSLTIGDLHVTVPAGAVASDTTFTMTVTDAHVPFTAYSPVIEFSPANLVLAQPLELRLPFHGDAARATAYAAIGGGSYAPQPTEIAGDVAIVRMTTLASTFVGTACEGSECTCEPIGRLDLLVVVDNSNSMSEEQALLRAQLPTLFHALAIGDTDGDGVQDAPAFDDVRVGITTTDLGVAGAPAVPTCDPGFGDDGMLLDVPGPAADASCTTPTYPSAYASYEASMPTSLTGFVAQIACTSSLGNMGCGFEQQLEAALLALSPNAATSYTAPGWTVPMFPEGRVGEGDMANAGFLRDGSILAVVYITDEDDCSTTDSNLFNPSDARFASTDLNLRCITYPEQLVAVSALVHDLVGLRPRPEDVVVGAITGVPIDLVGQDLGTVLADSRMQPHESPSMPGRIEVSCTSTNGVAFPAQRIVQSLQGVETAGGRAVLGSICDGSFQGFASDLVHALAARAGGSC